MRVMLDHEHELIVADDGSIQIVQRVDGERMILKVSLTRYSVRRMLAAMTNTMDLFDVGSVLRFTGNGDGHNLKTIAFHGEDSEEIALAGKEMVVVRSGSDNVVTMRFVDDLRRVFHMMADPADFERV